MAGQAPPRPTGCGATLQGLSRAGWHCPQPVDPGGRVPIRGPAVRDLLHPPDRRREEEALMAWGDNDPTLKKAQAEAPKATSWGDADPAVTKAKTGGLAGEALGFMEGFSR